MVAAFLRPWSGSGIRHIPAGVQFDVLDTRFAGIARDNRWNEAGDPTFYLASDLGVAVAEFGRHMAEERSAVLFLEKLPRHLSSFVTASYEGTFRISA